MASSSRRFCGFPLFSGQIRNTLPHLSSYFSLNLFSTMDLRSSCSGSEESSNHTALGEHYVLSELSKLIPVSCKALVSNLDKENSSRNQNQVAHRAVDGFLTPEEKLRGVFLQKLKGKSAIEKALTGVDVDLSIDIVANVLNRGHLSGEAMVTFFKWAIHEPGVSIDVDSYNVLLRALGRRKFFSHMMDVLRKMAIEGINPNLHSLSIAMDSFIRANYVHKAIKLFEESEELGMKCSTVSLNELLCCLCKRSRVSSASSMFNAKKGKIPFNKSTYSILIGGWSKLGEIEEMEKVLSDMVASGLNPDCSTFSHLIEGLGRAGRIDDAVEIFDHIGDKGLVPNTSVYNAMISNFVSIRNFDESMRYYKRMLDNECEPDLDTYGKLISAFLKARKVADALELFEEMLSRGIFPTTGLVTSFVKPLCSYGPPHAAMVIYRQAKKAGCRISHCAYKLLLMRLSRFGKCGMLLTVWDEMQESGYPCDVEVYEHIVEGLCNIGHLENAILVMEEALRKGFCPSRLVYSRLSNKLMASNKTEMAYRLFLMMKNARVQENACRYWRANGWHF